MNPALTRLQAVTRRNFLQASSLGLGSLALAELRADVQGISADKPLAPRARPTPAEEARNLPRTGRGRSEIPVRCGDGAELESGTAC